MAGMAQKVIMQLIDDLTGDVIDEGQGETVSFGLDGQPYTIDLTKENADVFRGLFQDYIAVAAKSGKRASGRTSKTATSEPSAKQIRDWARSNGMDVPERGRIPESVRAAFSSAS